MKIYNRLIKSYGMLKIPMGINSISTVATEILP